MSHIFKHIKIHVFRGFLALVPLGLSYLVMRFLYVTIDTRITGTIDRVLGFKIPGLGILLVVIILYLFGLAASHWAGRKALGLIDKITTRIPLIKTIYKLGKQFAEAFSLPEKQAFKKVCLVEHFKPGVWSVGFVTATIVDRKNPEEKMVRVFVPTAPNPTTGFVIMVKKSQVRELGWSVSEAMNSIISGGIVGPEEIGEASSP